MKTWEVVSLISEEEAISRPWQADDAAHAEEQHRNAFPEEDFVVAIERVANMHARQRTFDCTYGRHALVLRSGDDGPAFGRIDVTQLAQAGNPVFMPKDYVPRHAK